jgi:hypothetical protein
MSSDEPTRLDQGSEQARNAEEAFRWWVSENVPTNFDEAADKLETIGDWVLHQNQPGGDFVLGYSHHGSAIAVVVGPDVFDPWCRILLWPDEDSWYVQASLLEDGDSSSDQTHIERVHQIVVEHVWTQRYGEPGQLSIVGKPAAVEIKLTADRQIGTLVTHTDVKLEQLPSHHVAQLIDLLNTLPPTKAIEVIQAER